MSTSTARKPKDLTAPVKEKTPPPTTLTPRSADALPAHLRSDLEEYAGAGTSDRREDNLVPFLAIAQKGSPQVNPKESSYIPGLAPGWVFDTSTKQMWCAEEGNGPLMIQAHLEVSEVEWGLRGTPNKGYKGRHPIDTPLLSSIREVTREGGRGMTRMLPNGNQLVTTAYHYMILADDLRPIAVPMSSSNFQAHKALNTLLRNKKIRVPDRGLVVRPAFFTLLKLRTIWLSNDAGDWYAYYFEDLGDVTDQYLDAYEEAKALHKSALTSGIRTVDESVLEPQGGGVRGDYAGDPGFDPDADPTAASPI